MSDDFLDDESSAEDNRPVEIYTISFPTKIYYIASGVRDIYVSPNLYTAEPIARSEQVVSKSGNGTDMIVSLPVDHAIVKRFLLDGVPPKSITVTIYRVQLRSGWVERIHDGKVTGLAVEGRIAKLRVPERFGERALRQYPGVTVGRGCPHTLYDTMCKIDRNGSNYEGIPYKLITNVVAVDGTTVRVNLSNVPANSPNRARWMKNGELKHQASGEVMTVTDQNDTSPGTGQLTDLTIQEKISGMKVGDAVELYAGCELDLKPSCTLKFTNQRNFGGQPHINTKANVNWVWHVKTLE